MEETELEAGTVIADRYRLEEQIGSGAMGTVWRAEHLTLKVPVAVKTIREHLLSSPDALTRFMREARAAASIRSTHVVQILDHGVHDGVPFIVMELLQGESLGDKLARVQALSFEEIHAGVVSIST